MRHQQSTIVLLAAVAVACGDTTGPTRSVALSFCSGTVWAGFQNEGESWVTIANGPTDATINASERLVVARMTGGNEGELAFYYLTRDQAQATFVCPTPGTKSLSGSVAGVSGGSTRIWLGNRNAGTGTLFTTFTLTNLPDGPLDLVATHGTTAIIRRRVNYADGTTIPVLDFSSTEAFALQSHTVAIEANGVFAPEWATGIVTNGGTSATLSSIVRPCCVDDKIYTLPPSRQESGDLYRLTVAGGHRTDARLVERFYDTPSNQTVAFGPPVNSPTLTTDVAAGQLWRAEVAAQPEYASQIELVVERPQPSPTSSTMAIRASKEYFGGTPTTWAFTVPDLSSVTGFPSGWTNISVPLGWRLTASGFPWLFSASRARAGDVYRSATGAP